MLGVLLVVKTFERTKLNIPRTRKAPGQAVLLSEAQSGPGVMNLQTDPQGERELRFLAFKDSKTVH